MTRWADRHRVTLEAALESGESLRSADRVLLVNVSSVALIGPDAGRTQRIGGRRGGRRLALRAARARGVDLPARAFILAVTNRRLIVFGASSWLARPATVATFISRERVVTVRARGRLGFARLRVLLDDGTLIDLRPYGGGRLDHLADENADS